MTFQRRSHVECLSELEGWVRAGRPFCSLRLTDGELWAMFRYRPPTDRTADGNAMSVELGDAIRDTIRGFAEAVLADPDAAIQFGTTAHQHPDETTRWLMGYASSLGIADKLRWINGHDMLDGIVDGSTKVLMQSLSDYRGGQIVLCCDDAVKEACHCLRASYYLIPKPDSWLYRSQVLQYCRPLAKEGYTFVWCCGMGMKPVAWQLFREFPQSSHLDAGHIWDGVFGIESREWLRNKEEPWYTPYFDSFAPWVRSFMP